VSPIGSSIGCKQRLIKRRSQVRIFPPPTLARICQKKKKKKKRKYSMLEHPHQVMQNLVKFNFQSVLFYI
jgi:hypothetical protein